MAWVLMPRNTLRSETSIGLTSDACMGRSACSRPPEFKAIYRDEATSALLPLPNSPSLNKSWGDSRLTHLHTGQPPPLGEAVEDL